MKDYYVKKGLSLFWGGPYSQWELYQIKFEGKTFNCNEQFMMYCKALVHNDFETAKLIMKEKDPSKQKKLGRKVKNFTEDKWNKTTSMACVYIANYCKFTQHPNLNKYLLEDPGHTIVEASPYDTIWGIGLSADNPKAWYRSTWRGENRLGECIGLVRDYLVRPDSEDIDWHSFCLNLVTKLFAKDK